MNILRVIVIVFILAFLAGSLSGQSEGFVVLTSEQIQSLSYRSIEELIALQNGAVVIRDRDGIFGSSETEIHVRGGRDYENAIIFNGVNVVDPITGVYTAGYSTRAISEMEFYSAGFPARFGNANSGVFNLNTMSGSDKLSGFAEVQSDNEIGSDFGQNFYLAGLNGPIPITKNLRFFGMVERTELDDRYPSPITGEALLGEPNRLPKNWVDRWSYHGKITYGMNDRMRLSAHLDGSNQEWSEYRHEYYFDSVHTPFHDDDNLSIGGSFEHDVAPGKTSYALGVSFFKSERFQGDGVYREDLWGYGRPMGNPGTDVTNLFYFYDIDTTAVVYDTLLVDGQQRVFVVGGDEGHVYQHYLKHKAEVFTLTGQFSHSFMESQEGTIGFEFKRNSIRYYQHFFPTHVWQGMPGNGFVDAINYGYDDFGNESDNLNWENEPKHPTNLSLFMENSFRLGDLEVVPGVRFDRWDVDALAMRNLSLPFDPDSLAFDGDPSNDSLTWSLDLSDMNKVEPITKFSPRISLVAELLNDIKVVANVGTYYQLPPYLYLYNDYEFVGYKINTGGYFVPLANSGLKPEKSTQADIQVTCRVNPYLEAGFGGYLKSIKDQVSMYAQPSLPRLFGTYRNVDESNIKGLEIFIKLRDKKNLSAQLFYSHCSAEGLGSYPSTNYYVVWTNMSSAVRNVPHTYEQKHKIVGIFGFDSRGADKWNEDIQWLNNVLFKVVARYESSLPYTPIQVTNEATLGPFAPFALDYRNSERMPDRFTFDFYVERMIEVGSFQVSPFVSASNLFDKGNVADVWNSSGLPNSTGWLETPEGQQFVQSNSTPDYKGLNGEEKYRIKEQAPGHYYKPREFFVGLKGRF